ncbi:hypothetical protein [Longimicrobium sp.]|uniref:hypothetical protein n=1 Tax=Longimicrobium sp. TaxID=2029185 RepID=UPI002C9769FC|nr:hypothetical protein [Longimicrobium sp.]HSU17362.1 hypothetical protein [Longimicrobium sp.]
MSDPTMNAVVAAAAGAPGPVAALAADLAAGVAQVQSPWLYLQGAGSDGSDGSASGIHLRWDLLRELGEGHLPKGNLAAGPSAAYPAPYGFHRPDDFVTLLRVLYARRFPCVVSFATNRPVSVEESGPQRLWRFDTVVASTTPPSHREVVVRFADLADYDAVRASVDPNTAPDQFLARYTGVVEAEVTGQLCFALTLTARTTGDRREGTLRVEAVSVAENLPGAELFISCRRRYVVAAAAGTEVGNGAGEGTETGTGTGKEPGPSLACRVAIRLLALVRPAKPPEPVTPPKLPAEHRMVAENVKYFRFDCSGCTPLELRLESYEQFILGALPPRAEAWTQVGGGFALTDRDAVAYPRLENAAAPVNGRWPRYAGADTATGRFTASVPNYRAKWDPTLPPSKEPTDANGLRRGVIRYLTLSMSPANATADDVLAADNLKDGGAFGISYLRMLKLVALDFHVARMLGLGCIDAAVAPGTASHVYLAVYRTAAALEAGVPAAPRTHLSMTLPTSRLDPRLPPAPVQNAPTFGLSFDNGTGQPTQLTDAAGYTPFDDARMINLYLEPYDTVRPFGPFFVPPVQFCSSDVTRPVFYGFKHKLVSEAAYDEPEPSHDPEFADAAGVAEVVPLLPQLAPAKPASAAPPPIYTHEERENGLHRYAFYGVNWFSRPSPLGNPQDVDTLIPTRHTLLPPAALAVQLIQLEDPPLLTTLLEQKRLAAFPPGSDATLVRCTFEWNQNHYLPQKLSPANQYADRVQLFFRQEPPRAVQGIVRTVTSLSAGEVEVRTEGYTLTSITPAQTVTPAVKPGDEGRFVGGSFASGGVTYGVEGVAQPPAPGEGVVFRLRKQTQSTLADLDNANQFSASVQVSVPTVGDRFLAVENMNEPANWGPGQPLAKEVALVNFLVNGQLHRETASYADGSHATLAIGGVLQTANVKELPALDPNSSPPGSKIPNSRTGIFEIVFDTFVLAPHPDPDVEWQRGTVRIATATGEMKVLQVWKIEIGTPTLELTVYDPTFAVDAAWVPVSGYVPIKAGAGVPVNFHPGYRVYLTAQAGVLDEASTLPGVGQSSRQTFLSARSRNPAISSDSHLATPVVVQSRRIVPPEAPGEPAGPLYATRPDFYGKATWTMDVKVAVSATREPYGLVFYRANERSVLDVLYRPETADAALAAISALSDADAAGAWGDLVNVRLDADGRFKEHGGFRFPIPDNAPVPLPDSSPPALHGGYMIPETALAPFDGVTPPGAAATFSVGGVPVSMAEIVRGAIEGVFLPLTESPLIYAFIRSGTQTSAKKPVIRDANGDLLPFTDPAFDPSPMARRHNGDDGAARVRFTDYTLDGAAKNLYFYYAVEMSDQLRFSAGSAVAGPVRLVNAYPATAPAIRRVTSLIEDPVLGIATGVSVVVNAYLPAEGITRFALYRATNAADAASTRTMSLVGRYAAEAGEETELVDYFADLPFPPFGDPLFHRVVALRRITNERGLFEEIPSQPSDLARASIIDVRNPVAPPLSFTSKPPTLSHPERLDDGVISWPSATHNATYRLYRQEATGTWNRIHEVRTNASPVVVPLASTALGDGTLLRRDADGAPLYHRFRVEVENTSGMFSLNEDVLTVPATCSEGYSFFQAVVTCADMYQPAAPLADRLVAPADSPHPGSMTFQDAVSTLPTGHVFDRIEVTVADGLGNAARKTIAAAGGAVTFDHLDGTGIVLDGSVPNITYGVRVRVFTDMCPGGLLFRYTLRYGPEVELMGLASVLDYADSLATASPLEDPYVASGVSFPGTMTFTDAAALPPGHTFTSLEVTVQDEAGASSSQSITVPGGSVTFQDGDGGLALGATLPSGSYQVTARLFTDLAPKGVEFTYNVSYA